MEQKKSMTHAANGASPQTADGKTVQWDAFQNFNPNAQANMATLAPAGAAKAEKKVAEEGEEEKEETKEMNEHLDALFNGETLSEEFMNKAKTIFEAAVNERVNVMREEVLAEAAGLVQEEVETAGRWSWKSKSAKECVTTHLPLLEPLPLLVRDRKSVV